MKTVPAKTPPRLEPEETTDTFSPTQQDEIVDIVLKDADNDIIRRSEWVDQRQLDIQHYNCEKPSVIENLTKKSWQSDRNLGLCPAIVDMYHAVILSTSWNKDTLSFVATESNDIDNKNNLERFTKAILEGECNAEPEIDDYISNKLKLGFGALKISWRVWHEWVDKRIPNKDGKLTIKTENMRFEKGVIENVEGDDLLFPDFKKNLQEQPHLIHIVHIYGQDLLDMATEDKIKNFDERKLDLLKGRILDARKAQLKKEQADQLGLKDVSDEDIKRMELDCYEWYGTYKRGRKREKYRFLVEPFTRTFLAGKPLRKIVRTGKYPFVGGAFIKAPGFTRGKSLVRLISPIVNAFNNIWNQTADYQTVTNIPFGFHRASEGYTQQRHDLEPGVSYPTEGNPSEDIFFPSIQRSFAWKYQDFQLLFELLEKLTGAAAYFMTNQRNTSGTATRDVIVSQKSEVKFSLWVNRTIAEICEAITMLVNMYQDWAPPTLASRILGKDGKKIFPNLSVKTLRGNYDARMSPNLAAGSRAFEQQMMMWASEKLSQTIWLDPRVNPRGNWTLWADAIKVMGQYNPERWIGPEPKIEMGKSQQVEDEWYRFMQGEDFDPPEGENTMEHFIGHTQQKEEKYYDLDEEYRDNFDKHLFKTGLGLQNFIRRRQEEVMANQLASTMINNKQKGISDEVEGNQPDGGAPGISSGDQEPNL